MFGRDFSSKLIPTRLEIDGITVEGFVGRSDNVRANRNYQNFFINGRYVKSRTAGAALEQAYTSYIAPDKFPCCVLFLTINPTSVDVNVHPAKLEVKFSNEKPIFEAVYYSVRNALEQNAERPSVTLAERGNKSEWTKVKVSETTLPIEDRRGQSLKARQVESELFTAPLPKQEPKKIEQSSVGKAQKEGFVTMTAEEYVREYVRGGVAQTNDAKKEIKQGIKEVKEVKNEEKKAETENKAAKSEEQAQDMPLTFEQTEKALAVVADSQSEEVSESTKSLSYRIVGEAFNAYVIVERGDTMLLIDKHAAHERIIFEELKAAMRSSAPTSQMLMLPLEIMMTSDEIQTIEQYKPEIEATGFEISSGRYSVSVSAVPEGIGTDAVSDMLVVMAERLKSGTGTAGVTRDIVFEKALYQASCKAAIKAGREYAPEHVKWIVDKLMALPDITVCPHGRPVAMELSKKNLDRQFERT